MGSVFNYRLIIFMVATIVGIGLSIPSFIQSTSAPKISLGLDLQGGLYLLLGVKSDEAIKSKVKSIASSIDYHTKNQRIIIDGLKANEDSITLELIDGDEVVKLEEFLRSLDGMEMSKDGAIYNIKMSELERQKIREFAIEQAVGTIRSRLDQFGLAEPTVARQGEGNILVELPGIKNEEDERRARELIAKSAHLQMMAVDESRSDRVYNMSKAEAESYGSIILEDANIEGRKYLLKAIPILEGSMLTDARVAFDQNNQPVINFSLNSQGAKVFGDFSGENIGNRMAIVLDNKVYSAPVIRERIGGGSGQISGAFSIQEAGDIAIALRSGALLAPVEMLEKRSIGPSLGADSINAALVALISGFVLVIAFMAFYYGFAGIIANIAVVSNLFLIIAIMALFGATLTLPGMAGIILVVGMAVDSNVIINERIREFLHRGESLKTSLKEGYSNAIRAIVDANATTLIAAVILYAYGSGAIRGFAITISIGIIASMLTAILGTHGIYQALYNKIEKSKNYKFWFGIKG